MRISELVSDLQALRESLADELAAINHYEPLVDSLAHEEARSVVKRILDAKKHHAALLARAIDQLDPKQAEANRAAGA
jgi:rubrerythrin